MDRTDDGLYLVFARVDPPHGRNPEFNEEPLAECHSYEEARRVKHDTPGDCVIRFTGCVGGGD